MDLVFFRSKKIDKNGKDKKVEIFQAQPPNVVSTVTGQLVLPF